MSDFNWSLVAVVFWIFVLFVTVTPMVLHFLRRRETEKTIRMAIEKGQTLDPKMLASLVNPPLRHRADDDLNPHQVRFGGVVTLFVGLGFAAFGVFVGGKFFLGLAALLGCIGLGLIVGAQLLPAPRADARDPQA